MSYTQINCYWEVCIAWSSCWLSWLYLTVSLTLNSMWLVLFAGKTESTKLLVQHLVHLCSSETTNLHQQIIEVSIPDSTTLTTTKTRLNHHQQQSNWSSDSESSTLETDVYCVSQKNPPPRSVFSHFFPNGWEFLINFLCTYYAFLSTLDYTFLFNYLQPWQSYAILSETTHQIFDISLERNF